MTGGKRGAEAHTRYQEESSSSKKPRFDYRNPSTLAPDAPEEDAILELDEIGRPGQQTKRNAVKIDGYDSDSSEENFDTRAADKARQAKQSANQSAPVNQDEELDMFADMDDTTAANANGDDDHDDAIDVKKAKKAVRFMDVTDIEGQVHSSKSGGHVSADFTLADKGKRKIDQDVESSSESGSDEERDRLDPEDDDAVELGAGSKKHHAPKLDAFNMEQEGQEGRFDDSGNFVRKAADPDAVHDSWLDGLNKKDMKKAKDAQEKRDQDRRAKMAADDALLTSDLLSTLIQHLDKGESTLEALQRLQAQAKTKPKPKKLPKWKQKKKSNDSDAMDVDTDTTDPTTQQEDPSEVKRKAQVEAITGAADALFSRNQQDIYDKEREVLMRQYLQETGQDWQPPPSATDGGDTIEYDSNGDNMWEYRWADGRDGGEKHGPYDGQTMQAWNAAGYFGVGVEFKRVHDPDEWSLSVDFV